MRTRTTTVFVSALILSLLAGNALACGESLFRVGKGVAFRQYTAPLPGTILVVARTESELQLVQQLVAAGHDVHVTFVELHRVGVPDVGSHPTPLLGHFYRRSAVYLVHVALVVG